MLAPQRVMAPRKSASCPRKSVATFGGCVANGMILLGGRPGESHTNGGAEQRNCLEYKSLRQTGGALQNAWHL